MTTHRILSTLRWAAIVGAVAIATTAPTAAAVDGDTTWLHGTELAVAMLLLSAAALYATAALLLPSRRPVAVRAAASVEALSPAAPGAGVPVLSGAGTPRPATAAPMAVAGPIATGGGSR